VDYSKPLSNEGFPTAWAEHFLSPPFFKDGTVSTGSSVPVPVPSHPELTTVHRGPQKITHTEVENWAALANTSAGESDFTDVEDVSSASSDSQSLPEPAKVKITPSMTRCHKSFLESNRNQGVCYIK
jgi:hypothetical protein